MIWKLQFGLQNCLPVEKDNSWDILHQTDFLPANLSPMEDWFHQEPILGLSRQVVGSESEALSRVQLRIDTNSEKTTSKLRHSGPEVGWKEPEYSEPNTVHDINDIMYIIHVSLQWIMLSKRRKQECIWPIPWARNKASAAQKHTL